ncbi:MAG: DUF2934 domain-containing protein [Nitrospira sp.]|nr:DUF2934 domain-containing protein [Nitrospira sp.]
MDVQPTPRSRENSPRVPAGKGLTAKTAVRNQPSPPREDLQTLVAKRAYELYAERGYRHGYALEDWLEAEREILSRASPV